MESGPAEKLTQYGQSTNSYVNHKIHLNVRERCLQISISEDMSDETIKCNSFLNLLLFYSSDLWPGPSMLLPTTTLLMLCFFSNFPSFGGERNNDRIICNIFRENLAFKVI
jgi:hypothetical protein